GSSRAVPTRVYRKCRIRSRLHGSPQWLRGGAWGGRPLSRAAPMSDRAARAFLAEPGLGSGQTFLELLDGCLADRAEAGGPVELGVDLGMGQSGVARDVADDVGVRIA